MFMIGWPTREVQGRLPGKRVAKRVALISLDPRDPEQGPLTNANIPHPQPLPPLRHRAELDLLSRVVAIYLLERQVASLSGELSFLASLLCLDPFLIAQESGNAAMDGNTPPSSLFEGPRPALELISTGHEAAFFAARVFEEAHPLVTGLGSTVLEALASNARIHDQSHLSLRIQRLLEKARHGVREPTPAPPERPAVNPEANSPDPAARTPSSVCAFIPFSRDLDSRRERRSDVETVLLNNRGRCSAHISHRSWAFLSPSLYAYVLRERTERTRDAFYHLVRLAAERHSGTVLRSTSSFGGAPPARGDGQEGSEWNDLAMEARSLVGQVESPNTSWFASLFVEQVLHVALQAGGFDPPAAATAAADPHRLQALQLRLSLASPAPVGPVPFAPQVTISDIAPSGILGPTNRGRVPIALDGAAFPPLGGSRHASPPASHGSAATPKSTPPKSQWGRPRRVTPTPINPGPAPLPSCPDPTSSSDPTTTPTRPQQRRLLGPLSTATGSAELRPVVQPSTVDLVPGSPEDRQTGCAFPLQGPPTQSPSSPRRQTPDQRSSPTSPLARIVGGGNSPVCNGILATPPSQSRTLPGLTWQRAGSPPGPVFQTPRRRAGPGVGGDLPAFLKCPASLPLGLAGAESFYYRFVWATDAHRFLSQLQGVMADRLTALTLFGLPPPHRLAAMKAPPSAGDSPIPDSVSSLPILVCAEGVLVAPRLLLHTADAADDLTDRLLKLKSIAGLLGFIWSLGLPSEVPLAQTTDARRESLNSSAPATPDLCSTPPFPLLLFDHILVALQMHRLVLCIPWLCSFLKAALRGRPAVYHDTHCAPDIEALLELLNNLYYMPALQPTHPDFGESALFVLSELEDCFRALEIVPHPPQPVLAGAARGCSPPQGDSPSGSHVVEGVVIPSGNSCQGTPMGRVYGTLLLANFLGPLDTKVGLLSSTRFAQHCAPLCRSIRAMVLAANARETLALVHPSAPTRRVRPTAQSRPSPIVVPPSVHDRLQEQLRGSFVNQYPRLDAISRIAADTLASTAAEEISVGALLLPILQEKLGGLSVAELEQLATEGLQQGLEERLTVQVEARLEQAISSGAAAALGTRPQMALSSLAPSGTDEQIIKIMGAITGQRAMQAVRFALWSKASARVVPEIRVQVLKFLKEPTTFTPAPPEGPQLSQQPPISADPGISKASSSQAEDEQNLLTTVDELLTVPQVVLMAQRAAAFCSAEEGLPLFVQVGIQFQRLARTISTSADLIPLSSSLEGILLHSATRRADTFLELSPSQLVSVVSSSWADFPPATPPIAVLVGGAFALIRRYVSLRPEAFGITEHVAQPMTNIVGSTLPSATPFELRKLQTRWPCLFLGEELESAELFELLWRRGDQKKVFLAHKVKSDIVALFISPSTSPPDGADPDVSVSIVEYLDRAGLEHLLFQRVKVSGLLQSFIDPAGEYNSLVRATWSPQMCMVEKRTNRHKLEEAHIPAHIRAVTFDGPEHQSELVPLTSLMLSSRVERLCRAIAAHVASVSWAETPVRSFVLNFKVGRAGHARSRSRDLSRSPSHVDKHNRIWLLWASSFAMATRVWYPSIPPCPSSASDLMPLFHRAEMGGSGPIPRLVALLLHTALRPVLASSDGRAPSSLRTVLAPSVCPQTLAPVLMSVERPLSFALPPAARRALPLGGGSEPDSSRGAPSSRSSGRAVELPTPAEAALATAVALSATPNGFCMRNPTLAADLSFGTRDESGADPAALAIPKGHTQNGPAKRHGHRHRHGQCPDPDEPDLSSRCEVTYKMIILRYLQEVRAATPASRAVEGSSYLPFLLEPITKRLKAAQGTPGESPDATASHSSPPPPRSRPSSATSMHHPAAPPITTVGVGQEGPLIASSVSARELAWTDMRTSLADLSLAAQKGLGRPPIASSGGRSRLASDQAAGTHPRAPGGPPVLLDARAGRDATLPVVQLPPGSSYVRVRPPSSVEALSATPGAAPTLRTPHRPAASTGVEGGGPWPAAGSADLRGSRDERDRGLGRRAVSFSEHDGGAGFYGGGEEGRLEDVQGAPDWLGAPAPENQVPPLLLKVHPHLSVPKYMRLRGDPSFLYSSLPVCPQCAIQFNECASEALLRQLHGAKTPPVLRQEHHTRLSGSCTRPEGGSLSMSTLRGSGPVPHLAASRRSGSVGPTATPGGPPRPAGAVMQPPRPAVASSAEGPAAASGKVASPRSSRPGQQPTPRSRCPAATAAAPPPARAQTVATSSGAGSVFELHGRPSPAMRPAPSPYADAPALPPQLPVFVVPEGVRRGGRLAPLRASEGAATHPATAPVGEGQDQVLLGASREGALASSSAHEDDPTHGGQGCQPPPNPPGQAAPSDRRPSFATILNPERLIEAAAAERSASSSRLAALAPTTAGGHPAEATLPAAGGRPQGDHPPGGSVREAGAATPDTAEAEGTSAGAYYDVTPDGPGPVLPILSGGPSEPTRPQRRSKDPRLTAALGAYGTRPFPPRRRASPVSRSRASTRTPHGHGHGPSSQEREEVAASSSAPHHQEDNEPRGSHDVEGDDDNKESTNTAEEIISNEPVV
ncbi:hypothetical protein PAPYR_2444 [Paratrimastix pyriformis]|uniref:Uncharacterized protein n=1 Tax=Paratrimastix pyriformis TaxID=342808 RepID=A0ABQ8UQE4_9EUKA|nr:hypothetical protein PAPYR_2444 [Paratrimastix pyriformis]